MVVQLIPVTWKVALSEMVPIVDHEVDDFCDVACIVECPIHIVDRDGSREMLVCRFLDMT